jgi:hypothetical protein
MRPAHACYLARHANSRKEVSHGGLGGGIYRIENFNYIINIDNFFKFYGRPLRHLSIPAQTGLGANLKGLKTLF